MGTALLQESGNPFAGWIEKLTGSGESAQEEEREETSEKDTDSKKTKSGKKAEGEKDEETSEKKADTKVAAKTNGNKTSAKTKEAAKTSGNKTGAKASGNGTALLQD